MSETTNDAASPAALSFAEEQAAARALAARAYFGFVWRACLWVLVIGAAMALVLNSVYRLSVARTLYWPDSAPKPAMVFQEADPMMEAYVAARACLGSDSDSIDDLMLDSDESEACTLLLPWVVGDRQAVLRKLADADTPAVAVAKVEQVMLEQLRDAALRRDWATCAHVSLMARAVIDRARHQPWEVSPDRNQLLLLSAACEEPAMVMKHEPAFKTLVDSIMAGGHLDEGIASGLRQVRTNGVSAWGAYLQGLIALRAEHYADARKLFETAAVQGSGQLRGLALLGQSRSVFWSYVGLSTQARKSVRATALATLAQLQERISQPSFQRDAKFYREEISR
ncbi:hypothetical protein J2X16_002344 [Pelomonas aquatica]|uniref:Polysaccharide chain length determinant N-terminal domain-containing protein n=1 Tax=Pelomonas aquatica TaxID=431058 RepID=A0ABU1Z8R4_9BURK|nr:hypothetical protein [Pelomonas aquatica]MDR7296997.1 hypothetical protein [Pelomonas aquatica]